MAKRSRKRSDEERILEVAQEMGITPENPASTRQARKDISPSVQLRYKVVRRVLKENRLLTIHD
ncbi:MAG: hypothetical protein GX589_09895 [Deltaproteobacteria bacterium]|nr:hypothetical protein [Deltaproteobacteria bacterium]